MCCASDSQLARLRARVRRGGREPHRDLTRGLRAFFDFGDASANCLGFGCSSAIAGFEAFALGVQVD